MLATSNRAQAAGHAQLSRHPAQPLLPAATSGNGDAAALWRVEEELEEERGREREPEGERERRRERERVRCPMTAQDAARGCWG